MTSKQLDGAIAPDGSTYSTITDGDGNLSTEPVLITGGLKQRFGNRAPDGSRYRVLTDGAGTIFAGGGGGGYVAKAVTFDGSGSSPSNAYFISDALSVSDSPLGLFSYWLYWEPDTTQGANAFATTLNGGYWRLDAYSSQGNTTYAFNFWDTTNSLEFDFRTTLPNVDGWQLIQAAVDTNHPAGEKIGLFTLNRVLQSVTITDNADAFNIGWSQDSDSTAVGIEDGYNTPNAFSLAEFYAGMGQYLDISQTVNLNKFSNSSNKPVSLGTDGSLPTGTSPTIYFKGDASSYPNSGTGGTFTKTVNGSGTFTNASTSPSD